MISISLTRKRILIASILLLVSIAYATHRVHESEITINVDVNQTITQNVSAPATSSLPADNITSGTFRQFYNFTNTTLFFANVNVSGTINATRINASLNCGFITGGTDSNFCDDATGAGGGNFGWTTGATTVFNNTAGVQVIIGSTTGANGAEFTVVGEANFSSIVNASSIDSQNIEIRNATGNIRIENNATGSFYFNRTGGCMGRITANDTHFLIVGCGVVV